MIISALAGIKVFATGGIGGVHRGAETTMDISADLEELAMTPVCVVCEMMDSKTGQATSVADAKKYAEENGLVLLKGEDIIKEYLKE